ncbi:MAG: sugar transferase [Desulfuromonadaceae bacterium]
MRKENQPFLIRSHKVIDILLTVLAFCLAYTAKRSWLPAFSGLSTEPNYYFILLVTLVFCSLAYDFFGLYRLERRPVVSKLLASIIKGAFVGTAGALVLLYLIKEANVSRLLMMIFLVFDVLLLCLFRGILILFGRFERKRGLDSREILVIGSRMRARDLVSYIRANQDLGYNLIGCLDPDAKRVGVEVFDGVRVIGALDDYRHILLNQAVDEVIFAMPLNRIDNVLDYISLAEEVGVNIRVLPDWQIQKMMYQPEIASVQIENFVGIPALTLSSTPRKGFELFVKAVIDRGVAIVGLILLAPFFALLALLIKLESRGPVFFQQQRSGLNGRVFTLYKFRSMVCDAEARKAELEQSNEMDGPVFKMAKDPRITRIGAFLRRTSLDELPQLINVARGEMSLVGPRPPLPQEVQAYEPWQRRRLSMKPGLTCIWQVSGRNNINFEQWMKMDLEYIDRWSLWFDFQLLLKTLPAVFMGTGR